MAEEAKVRWKHGETGRVSEQPPGQHPGKGWFAIDCGGWLDVGEIVADWLEKHGYDGLVNEEVECGCTLDDFAPCGDIQADCVAAYRHPRALCWMMPMPHVEGCACAEEGVDDE